MCLLTTRRSTAGQQRASCGDSRPRNRPWSHKDKKTHTPCTKPHSSLSSNHVNTQLYLSTPFIRCLCCLEKSTLPPQAACDTWPDKQTTTACSWIPIKTWRSHTHTPCQCTGIFLSLSGLTSMCIQILCFSQMSAIWSSGSKAPWTVVPDVQLTRNGTAP